MQIQQIVLVIIWAHILAFGFWYLQYLDQTSIRAGLGDFHSSRHLASSGTASKRLDKEPSNGGCPHYNASVGSITPEQISKCDQKDPILWAYIRRHHITSPSNLPYSFPPGQPMGESLPPVWPILKEMTKGKREKIFVEAGAHDGFNYSQTIWLEESQGWSGVLIECNPELRPKLLSQNRKAWVVDTCLCKTEHPTTDTLTSVTEWVGYPPSLLGSLIDVKYPTALYPFAPNVSRVQYQVQSMPLFAILAALDIKVVDYFSLDIQSMELHVLRTFPFDLIHVKMWMIEMVALSEEDRQAVVELMHSKGYIDSNILESPIPSIGYKVRVPLQDLMFISTRREPW